MENHNSKYINEQTMLNLLSELDQKHIIIEYNSEKRNEEERKIFLEQINKLERVYPGGLREYIKRSKVLLNNSMNNVNPYSKFTPSIPEGVKITVGDDEFFNLESIGLKQIFQTGFVLAAGGLGERLGYDGIKIEIPSELVSGRGYFRVYADYLLAYEHKLRKEFNLSESDEWFIPLCIMVSDDTDQKTEQMLRMNNNFGLKENQIEIVKQEKAPCLLDNDCHLALLPNQLLIDTKPHGHGDIHTVLHQYGVIDRWISKGKKWVIFFQDTNALVFNAIPSSLGVSSKNNFVVNSLAIPRIPGDAIGAICKLTDIDGKCITINVEYNQLDCLLKDKFNPNGDIPNDKGLSYFPGNTNVLIFEINSYNETLRKTRGLMPEFVNPKYNDQTKTTFKSPTRLECMMQDYPLLLEANEKVGFTMYDRWFCFSTCKNNLNEGIKKLNENQYPDTAFRVEQDIFDCNCFILKDILGKLEINHTEEEKTHCPPTVDVLGKTIKFSPKIIIFPSFAVTLGELNKKIHGKITLTDDSTLLLKGEEASINDLILDGTYETNNNLNEGQVINHMRYYYVPLKDGEGEKYEKIRGYSIKKSKINIDGSEESFI